MTYIKRYTPSQWRPHVLILCVSFCLHVLILFSQDANCVSYKLLFSTWLAVAEKKTTHWALHAQFIGRFLPFSHMFVVVCHPLFLFLLLFHKKKTSEERTRKSLSSVKRYSEKKILKKFCGVICSMTKGFFSPFPTSQWRLAFSFSSVFLCSCLITLFYMPLWLLDKSEICFSCNHCWNVQVFLVV